LQLFGGDAVAPRGNLEHRLEPDLERLPGLLQQRARREARLVVAISALEQEAAALGPLPRPFLRCLIRSEITLPSTF
jgi:hypothetical protein